MPTILFVPYKSRNDSAGASGPQSAAEGAPEIATNEHWRSLMRRARQDAGLTQAELATKVGVSQNVISQIEGGQQSSSSAVMSICKALRIPPPVALFRDELDQRWYEAGRLIRSRDPKFFAAQLEAMEAFAMSLSASDET